MKKLKLIACLLWVNLGFSQSYSFLSYSTREGLPQSQVSAIAQDQSGYLWAGTLSGLAKFNGKKFVNYSSENGLTNNRITSLTQLNNQLWIGHEGGVSCIENQRTQSWGFHQEDRIVNVSAITIFKNKTVIATNGGGLYIIDKKAIKKVPLSNEYENRCRSLLVIGDALYIGTMDGIMKTSNLKSFTKLPTFAFKNVSSVARKGSEIYIATYGEGLFKTNEQFNTKDSIPLKLPEINIQHLFIDDHHQIWLASRNDGAIRINEKGEQLILNEKNGLPVSAINCIFEDREGIIWMGTEGKGLIRFTGEQFVYFNQTNGFPSDLIVSGIKYQNEVLIGSYDHGLFKYLNKQNKTIPLEFAGNTIWSLEVDNSNNLWVASENGIFMQPKNGKITTFNFNPRNRKATVIERYDKNKLIAGGSAGIGWIYDQKLHPIQLKTNFEKTIGTVRDFQLFAGNLYCASDKGLFIIYPSENKFERIKQLKTGAKSIGLDDINRLWIGTENGLFIYDGIELKEVKLSSGNGSKFINFQYKVEEYMYFGTNNGVYILNSKDEEPKVIKRLGINDGLINLESNINSAFQINNHLWFGTAEGLVRLNLNSIDYTTNQFIRPLLNVTEILVNYKPYSLSSSGALDLHGLPNHVDLPYNRNNIAINLDGLMLGSPEGLRFQFWLEGLDETWSPTFENPSIVLSNIPSGDYTLHIRAINEIGTYSEDLTLSLIITPPFWGTWWFYILVAILLTLGIRYYFRLQIRRVRDRNYKENLENKTRLLALEQQSLNASMNRHFIFNSLNSIQYFINTQDRVSANRYLTAFAKLIRKNLDSAAEDDNLVTLEQELERLELYLSLESMRFKDRFTYAISCEGIDAEQVVVPAMLLQPFVENSIIHGILPIENTVGHIQITIKTIGLNMEICIDDNGVGIDKSLQSKAKFQGDHKSQGMEITSKRIDLIRKMWKKDYELYGPFQMNNSDLTIKGTRVLIKIPTESFVS